MTEADLALVLEWRNSERVRPYMYTTHEISLQEHLSWWRRASVDESVRHYIFEIAERPMGVLNIVDMDSQNGTAAWGFYVGAEDAPQGAGSALGFLGLEEAFVHLGLRAVRSSVLASNTRSINLHRRLGFAQEQAARSRDVEGGDSVDTVEFTLSAEEWAGISREIALQVFCEPLEDPAV